MPWSQDGADPQECPSTPGSEVDQLDAPLQGQPSGLGADQPLLMPSTEPSIQGAHLLASGGTCSSPWACSLGSASEQGTPHYAARS